MGTRTPPTSRFIGGLLLRVLAVALSVAPPCRLQRQEVAGLTVPDADLDRIRAEAAQLRAGLRYGQPPAQKPGVTEDERREQSPTGHLWPVFVEPRR